MEQKKPNFRNTELSIDERLEDLLERLSIDEKIGLLSTHQKAVERLGVGEWYIGTEVARGYVSRNPLDISTVFPQPIGLAATFNRELLHKLGEIAGTEARLYHKRDKISHLSLWGPTVDMTRDPRWGRTEECYGEDPFLEGQLSAAYCRGIKGNDPKRFRAIATLKHFCANNVEEQREYISSNLTPRMRYEYYYEAFREAIESGAADSVMASYNALNGLPAMLNPDLKRVLKDKWGLMFAVTDGGGFSQPLTTHRYTSSHAETLALALEAGADVMTDNEDCVAAAAYEALDRGLITEADIDSALKNSMRARFMFGEFDGSGDNAFENCGEDKLNCEEFKEINRQAARECVILLKNSGILPLSKDKKIAVIGPNGGHNFRDWYTGYSGYEVTTLDGIEKITGRKAVFDDAHSIVALKSFFNGKYLCVDDNGKVSASMDSADKACLFKKFEYSDEDIVLQSVKNGMYLVPSKETKADGKTLYGWNVDALLKPYDYNGHKGFRNVYGADVCINDGGGLSVDHHCAVTASKLFDIEVVSDGIERAAASAKEADTVILCLGNEPMTVARECKDRADLELPPYQKRLCKSILSANPETVMLITSSYTYAIGDELEKFPAVVYSAHGGAEQGTGIAEVLFGITSPSGKSPVTWYRSHIGLPDINDYDIIENDMTYMYYKGDPIVPFGFGLSYCEFEYGRLSCQDRGERVNLNLTVTNISDIDGYETVQIYFEPLNPSVKRPRKQLCAFKKIFFKAKEERRLKFEIPKSRFKFYDVSRECFAVEDLDYRIFAGSSSADEKSAEVLHISGEKIPKRDLTKPVSAVNFDEKSGVKIRYSKTLKSEYVSSMFKGAYVTFKNVDIRSAQKAVLEASSDAPTGEFEVFGIADGGKETLLGKALLRPSFSPEHFSRLEVDLTADAWSSDIKDIKIKIPGAMNLKSFYFE